MGVLSRNLPPETTSAFASMLSHSCVYDDSHIAGFTMNVRSFVLLPASVTCTIVSIALFIYLTSQMRSIYTVSA